MQNNSIWDNSTFKCPYCHALSTFSCTYSAKGFFKGIYYPISVWSCHHCDRAIFIKSGQTIHDSISKQGLRKEIIFPSLEPKVDERVPVGIANDFIEASKCFNISAFKASATMARRTIQKICLNLGADKKKKLYEQINDLKNLGRLHSDLAEIATEIRFLGNDGAHPDIDGLDDLNEAEVQDILDFTLELLDDLYVRPSKVQTMKKRREDKGK